MKRIIKFVFQALKDTIDLTVLGKSAHKTTNIATPKKTLSDSLSLLSFQWFHCKKAKTQYAYPATNIPPESAYLVLIHKNCYI